MDLKVSAILGETAEHHWYYSAKALALRVMLGRLASRRILDVGAGSGFFSRQLLRTTAADSVQCLDPNYPGDSEQFVGDKSLHFRTSFDGGNADLVLLMDVLAGIAAAALQSAGRIVGVLSGPKTMNNPLHIRFFRYVVTGLALTAIHTLLATAFIELVSPIPAIANGLAFTAATVLSYLVNTHWSFSARLTGESFRRFLIVSAIGLVLAILISWGVQLAGHHYLWGILAVAASVTPVTFLLHNFWTYRA